MIRRVASVFAILFAAIPIGGTTRADLCLEQGARASLDDADAAFIGKLVSLEEPKADHLSSSGGGRDLDLRFEVEEAVKGPLGRHVQVRSDALGVPLGKRLGLLLERWGDTWVSGPCSKIDPDVLRRAAAPLPAPDSRGPVAFLVGGRFGDVRTVALDRDGRVVAYGSGRGYTATLAVCEGSRRVVEVFRELVRRRLGSGGLLVRDIATLGPVRGLRMEELDGTGWWPEAVSCRDPTADDVFIALEDDDERVKVVRLRRGERSVVFDGRGRWVSFSAVSDVAYLAKGKSIVELDLRTGQTRPLVTLPLTPASLELNPGESALAGTNGSSPPKGRVFTVDLQTREVSIVPGPGGKPVWLNGSRFVVLPGEGEVRTYDRSLNDVQPWRDRISGPAVAVDGKVYSAAVGEFVEDSPANRDVRLLLELDSDQITDLVFVRAGPTRPAAGPRPGPLAIVLAVMALIVALGLRRSWSLRHAL